MALQDNNLMLLDLSDGFPRTIDNANDTIGIGVDTSFAQDVSVGGTLTVTGDIISGGTMDVVVTDNFIDLSNGQVNGANKAGGLTVNVQSSIARVGAQNAVFQSQAQATGAFATLSIPGFDPSTGGVGGASLADGDVIEISGAADLAGNNGLFIIEAITAGAGGLIEIKNAPQTQSPWAQTNFEGGTETAAGASFAPAVDLGVFCISDGNLLDIGGNTIPVGQFVSAFKDEAKLSTLVYEAAANVSLQEAYNVGQQILLSDAQGNLDIRTDDTGPRADFLLQNQAAAASYLATSSGSLKVGDGSTIKVNMAGQVSSDVVFDGVGARTISQAGQNLTMSVSGAANLSLASAAGQVNLDSADASRFAMAANDANNKALAIIAQNGGGGEGNLALQADDIISSACTNLNLGASAKIDLNSQGAAADALVLQAPNGSAQLNAANGVNVTATGAAAAVQIASQQAGVSITSNNADVDVASSGTGKVDIDGANGVTVNAAAGGFQIEGAGAQCDVQADSQNLRVRTFNSGNLLLDAAGNVASTAATNWGATATAGDMTLGAGAAGSFTAATTMTVQGGGKLTLTSTATDVDINAGTSLTMDSATSMGITAGNGLTATATTGDAQVIASAAAAKAVLQASQGEAEVLAAQAVQIGCSGGSIDLVAQNAASKIILTSSGTAADAIHLNASAGGLDMEANNAVSLVSATGSINLAASAAGQDVEIDANGSSHFKLAGAAAVLTLESTNGGLALKSAANGKIGIDGFVEVVNTEYGAGYEGVAKITIPAGSVVMAEVGGADLEVNLAARTSAGIPVGFSAAGAANPNDPIMIHTLQGYPVKTGLAVNAGDVGKFLYLDAAGAMTLTVPVASGDYVWRMGAIVGRAGGNAVLLWAPQFIAKRP